MRFRRKELPADLVPAADAFAAVLAELEPAKAGLSDVLPGTRMPGRPLADALAEFETRLARAELIMPAWRRSELEAVWIACDEGLRAALDFARRARREAPDVMGFEGLLGLVEELLDPLDPFADAEARFEQLREVVRRGRTRTT